MIKPDKLLRIELSAVCNYQCKFCCWQNIEMAGKNKQLSAHEIALICKAIAASGCTNINITGGEPLMLPIDYLCTVIKTIRSCSEIKRLWVTTNGNAFRDEQTCRMLAQAGLQEAAVSIAAETDEKYIAYTGSQIKLCEIMSGIKNALANSIQIRVHIPVNPVGIASFEQLEVLLDMLANVGVTSAFLFKLHTSDKIDDIYKNIFIDPQQIIKDFESSKSWVYGESSRQRPFYRKGSMTVFIPRDTIQLVTDSCKRQECGAFCQGIYSAYLVPDDEGFHVRACHRIFVDKRNEYGLNLRLSEEELAAFFAGIWRYAYE